MIAMIIFFMSKLLRILFILLFSLFLSNSFNSYYVLYNICKINNKIDLATDNYINSLNLKNKYQIDFLKKTIKTIYLNSYNPNITMAQLILESNWGRSELCKYNNYLGIKGGDINLTTQEYYNNHNVYVKSNFKKFDSLLDQINYHNNEWGIHVKDMSISKAIVFLKDKNYATDPNYGKKIKKIINNYKLTEYEYIISREIRSR